MRWNIVLDEPHLTDYVDIVGIEVESLNVIHGGLSELAGQEMFGESVWETTTLLCFPQ